MALSAVAQTTVTLTNGQDDTTARDTTGNNLTLTVNNADNATHSGAISGTGSLTKDGTGALTLAAANTLTGDTNLTAGTIVLGNSSALATSRLVTTAGTTLSFGSLTAATLGGLTNTGTATPATDITLENGSSAAVALTVNTNDSNYIFHDYDGVLSGSGSLIKTGAWDLRLLNTNTYTGGTTLAGGRLNITGGTLGPSGTISFAGGELSGVSTDLSSRFSTAAGQSIKVGAFGSVAFASNLTSTGGTFELTTGTVTLTGSNTYAGGTTISGGTLILGGSGALPATGSITFTGGTLALFDSTDISGRFSTATGQAFKVDTNGNNVTFATGLSSASSSSFTKAGAGTLTLTAASTYSGTTSVRGGTLLLGAATTLPSAKNTTVNGDGLNATLDLNGNNLTIGTLSLGGTSTTSSATITTGSGTLTLGGTVTFSASSNPLGATIAGKVDLGTATRTFTIGNSTTAASDLTISAVISSAGGARGITKSGLGTLTLSGANTYTGPTTVSAGTLNLTGSATGSAFTVGSTGTLAGSGTLGALTLNSGSFLSPGNSPGTLNAGNTTFAGGATYNWEVNDAAGVAGTNWDLLAITGTLTITATSGTPFNLALKSLTAGDAAGIVPNFNETQNATFVIASTTGGITGFAANAFVINTSGFANAFTGTWSVAANGNNLELNYAAAAIPEPSGLAAMAGLAGLGVVLWRRRSAKVPAAGP